MTNNIHQQIGKRRIHLLLLSIWFVVVSVPGCQRDNLITGMSNSLSKSNDAATYPNEDQSSSYVVPAEDTTEPATQIPSVGPPQSNQEAGEKITIKIVFDNYLYQDDLENAWGFSAFITYKNHNVLFDTGAVGRILLDNMAKMAISPKEVQNVVLSHDHNDHTAGLQEILSKGANPRLYIPPSFSRSFKDQYQNKLEVIEVVPGLSITERISTTGEITGSPPEQALVIDTTKGLVVITGCAHPGVDKIAREAKRLFKEDIYLVLGGFHLGNASSYQVDQIINELKRLNVKQVAPCHCTGDQAIKRFKEAFGEDFIQVGVGKIIDIDL